MKAEVSVVIVTEIQNQPGCKRKLWIGKFIRPVVFLSACVPAGRASQSKSPAAGARGRGKRLRCQLRTFPPSSKMNLIFNFTRNAHQTRCCPSSQKCPWQPLKSWSHIKLSYHCGVILGISVREITDKFPNTLELAHSWIIYKSGENTLKASWKLVKLNISRNAKFQSLRYSQTCGNW